MEKYLNKKYHLFTAKYKDLNENLKWLEISDNQATDFLNLQIKFTDKTIAYKI